MVTGLFAGQHNTKLHGTITGVIFTEDGLITLCYDQVIKLFKKYTVESLRQYSKQYLVAILKLIFTNIK